MLHDYLRSDQYWRVLIHTFHGGTTTLQVVDNEFDRSLEQPLFEFESWRIHAWDFLIPITGSIREFEFWERFMSFMAM